MDQNNMSQQENFGGQPAEQVQNPYMQPMQPQPAYQPPMESDDVSMNEWMWTILLLGIPVVNFILLIVWAFGGGTKVSKANFCKAQLLWMLIVFCLSFVLSFIFFFVGFGLIGSQISSYM